MSELKTEELKINQQSIKNDLSQYRDKPLKCLFEYIWNSFDAGAYEVKLNFEPPSQGLGLVEKVKIIDDGEGWDFDDRNITNNFKSSSKKPSKYKTLPKGQYGRGIYTFIWIA